MDPSSKQNTIARVRAMLIAGGDGEMVELTRDEVEDIRREVCAKLADEKSVSRIPDRQ